MIDMDLVQSTFEYALRKKLFDGEIPADASVISCDNRYYIVDHKGVTLQQLWDKIVDKEHITNLPEADHFAYFNNCIDDYIANLSITDPLMPGEEYKLSSLPYWMPVKSIPKKYYRR